MKAAFLGKLYVLTVPVFFVVDLIWLGVIAKSFYRRQLGSLMRPEINWTAAILFYLLYISGILIFAVLPALEKESAGRALVMGGLFGLFTYATYDLTNLATIRDWPPKMVVVDICWGVLLCAGTALAAFFIGKWLQ